MHWEQRVHQRVLHRRPRRVRRAQLRPMHPLFPRAAHVRVLSEILDEHDRGEYLGLTSHTSIRIARCVVHAGGRGVADPLLGSSLNRIFVSKRGQDILSLRK